MLLDHPDHPLRLTTWGRVVLAIWATVEALLFVLVFAAWLK